MLAYVWLEDGTFWNALLVAEGYAQQLTIPPNVTYERLFRRLVGEARRQDRGPSAQEPPPRFWRGGGGARPPPNLPHGGLFRRLVGEARRQDRGLWAQEPQPSS